MAEGRRRSAATATPTLPGTAPAKRLLSLDDLITLTGFQKDKIYQWMNLPALDPLHLPWVRTLGDRRVKYEDFAAWYDRLESD